MSEFSDEDIRTEAFRLWEAEGRPLWSHGYDNWFRARENLRRQRSAERERGGASPAGAGDGPAAPSGPSKG